MSRLHALHGCFLVLCTWVPLSACDDGTSTKPTPEDAGPGKPTPEDAGPGKPSPEDAGPGKPSPEDAGPGKPIDDAGPGEPSEDAGPDRPPCYAPVSPEPFDRTKCELADGALTCPLCVGTCVYDTSGTQVYELQCGPGFELLDIESNAPSPGASASECPTLYRLGSDDRHFLTWQDIWTANPQIPCEYPGEPDIPPPPDGGTLGPED